MDFAESEFFTAKSIVGHRFSPFATFHANISHIVRDIAFKQVFKMAAAAILDFAILELNFDGNMACGVWFLVPV